jgi:hypothetical protein
MIKMHYFNEACQYYKQNKISFRLLQDQATVMLGLCQNPHTEANNPLEVAQADIDWLLQQSEASLDYADYLGGYVYVCETDEDLLQIQGCDFEWAEANNGNWPNVTDIVMSWDACNYMDEISGDPQWVIFMMYWNDAGGPVYYVPKHLWAKARVTEHIEASNPALKP